MAKNLTPYRIIYGDTDQMGVAYYANYLQTLPAKKRTPHRRRLDQARLCRSGGTDNQDTTPLDDDTKRSDLTPF